MHLRFAGQWIRKNSLQKSVELFDNDKWEIKVESFQSLTCEKHNSKLRKGSRDLDTGFVVIRQFCCTSIHCSISASSTGHLNWMGLNWRKKNIMGIMCSVVRNFRTAAGRKQKFRWRRTSLINKAVLDQGQEHGEGLNKDMLWSWKCFVSLKVNTERTRLLLPHAVHWDAQVGFSGFFCTKLYTSARFLPRIYYLYYSYCSHLHYTIFILFNHQNLYIFYFLCSFSLCLGS